VNPFVILWFLVRHSIFNVLERLQEFHKYTLYYVWIKVSLKGERLFDFLGIHQIYFGKTAPLSALETTFAYLARQPVFILGSNSGNSVVLL